MANLNQDALAKFLAMEQAEQAQNQKSKNAQPADPYAKSKPTNAPAVDLNESSAEYKRMTTKEEAEERLGNNINMFS